MSRQWRSDGIISIPDIYLSLQHNAKNKIFLFLDLIYLTVEHNIEGRARRHRDVRVWDTRLWTAYSMAEVAAWPLIAGGLNKAS